MSTWSQKMVVEQLRPHGVHDERVLEVMASIPREAFLPPRQRRHAYEDRALAIDCGQTISQPLVVALMTQAAAPQPVASLMNPRNIFPRQHITYRRRPVRPP